MLLISHLNFSVNSLSLYLISLITFLNSCINSSIIFLPYSNLLNSTALTISSSLFPNSFLRSAKNSPAILYSKTSIFRSSKIFSFYTSAEFSCIYNKIYCICFSTVFFLILILINNLHAIINSKIFSNLLSNTYSLATSILDPVLGLGTTPFTSSTTNST